MKATLSYLAQSKEIEVDISPNLLEYSIHVNEGRISEFSEEKAVMAMEEAIRLVRETDSSLPIDDMVEVLSIIANI